MLDLFNDIQAPLRNSGKSPRPDTTATFIKGTVEKIFCYKNENGWAAIGLDTPGGFRKVSGIMPGVRIGMTAEFTGRFEENRYGLQFKADTYMETRPSDIPGIEKYLASNFVKNIGPVLAKQIVRTFGEATLDVLDNHPERLKEVFGIGKKRAESIIAAAKEHREIRSIMLWLKRYDLSDALATKVYNAYGTDSIRMLERNPYCLADDIHGVGFKRADAAARLLGVAENSPFRLHSGIKACLEDRAAEGDTYIPVDDLVKRASGKDYLDIAPELVLETLRDKSFKQVKTDGDDVFLPSYYRAEKTIAARLRALASVEDPNDLPDIGKIEKQTGVSYSDEQRSAILSSFMTNVLVITGGPGTGKTVTTNAIIGEFEGRGKQVLLAAPTGRAAKRMNEVTGREAKTIHRLLEYYGGSFQRNEDMPLSGDVLIVDESSMIDTLLMKDLLKAVPDTMKLILVGDVDQLPSVGAGSVLRDIIDSDTVPTVRLTQIYRQAQGSAIIMGAHAVNRGRKPDIANAEGTDLWMFRVADKERIAELIVDLVTDRIPKKLGFQTDDIQVLTPMRREWDPIGATALNTLLQQSVNPDGQRAAKRENGEYRVGDRVMQIKNNYDKDVFNGDIGTITRGLPGTDEDKAILEACFEGKYVRYTSSDLSELELAYACTVHKSQGSEYPVVVMPVHTSQYVMLKRNLLYTGITRAKHQCILVGTDEAIDLAVHQEETVRRKTRLKERLLEEKRNPTTKTSLF